MHYTRWHRHGDHTVNLHPRRATRGYVEHGTPEGYNHHKCRCDICREWRRDYGRAYRKKHAVKLQDQARTRILRRLGMTREDGDRVYAEQGGACAICRRPFAGLGDRALHADHDHTTGEFRGFLCRPCNLGLGQLEDDPQRLLAAVRYLEARHITLGSEI